MARLQHRGVGIERRFAQQRRELGGARAGVADDDPRWMEIVVERLALAQELGRKDDRIAAGLGAHPLGEADRHRRLDDDQRARRSEEHTSELQSLMRISYAVFCLKKKTKTITTHPTHIY